MLEVANLSLDEPNFKVVVFFDHGSVNGVDNYDEGEHFMEV